MAEDRGPRTDQATPARRSALGPRCLAILPALLVLACSPASSPRLVIATNWPEVDCLEIERAIGPSSPPLSIHWVRVAPEDDPCRVLDHRVEADLVLGGPTSSIRHLAETGRLSAGERAGDPPWALIPRNPQREVDDHPADPRRDPRRRAVEAVVSASDPEAAYADLVLSAAEMGSSSVMNADRRPAEPTATDAVAILSSAPHPEQARAFLAALNANHRLEPPVHSRTRPEAEALLADLLGSGVIEARPELHAAWLATEQAGGGGRERLTEPPPWPPGSIARMKGKADGKALIATLAENVAPDPEARAWLLSSFDATPRPIDLARLNSLAEAAGGRLVAEPRFRAWLRSEWTAWARQRFRRVGRRAEAGSSPP